MSKVYGSCQNVYTACQKVYTDFKAFAKEDLKGFLSYSHPDFRGWYYEDPLPHDKAAWRKKLSYILETTETLVYELNPVAIDVHGNVACVHNYYTLAYKDAEDKHRIKQGRWTGIYMKDGDKWLMICGHGGLTSAYEKSKELLEQTVGEALTSAPTLLGQEWSREQREVCNTVKKRFEAHAKEDIEGKLSYFHTDFCGWWPGEPLPSDKAASRKWSTYLFETTETVVLEFNPVAIDVYGNVGCVHLYYKWAHKDAEGKHRIERGRETDIYIKDGNKWLLIWAHDGPRSLE